MDSDNTKRQKPTSAFCRAWDMLSFFSCIARLADNLKTAGMCQRFVRVVTSTIQPLSMHNTVINRVMRESVWWNAVVCEKHIHQCAYCRNCYTSDIQTRFAIGEFAKSMRAKSMESFAIPWILILHWIGTINFTGRLNVTDDATNS